MKARNAAALNARKKAIADAKAAEATKALPEGWRRVESNSRPGEFVYENVHTEERQAWFPDGPAVEEVKAAAVPASAPSAAKEALKAKNAAALAAMKAKVAEKKKKEDSLELPAGWERGESRSRPGETVYVNTVTGERQAWFPDAPCLSEADIKKADLKKKNAEALKKRAAALKNSKDEDAKKKLPDGWRRVESRSRPGEFVYENIKTEERQAWFPEAPAEDPLPAGWKKVESRTYPGEFVYENLNTGERQAWVPTEVAPTEEGVVSPPAPAASEEKKYVGKATAIYDFTATNREEEIDLIEGDVIMIEYKADNGWWVGVNQRTNRNGIFPGTYVEE